MASVLSHCNVWEAEQRAKRKKRRRKGGGFDLTKRHMPHLYSADDDLTRGSHLQLGRAGCLRLAPRKSGSTTAATEW